MTREEKLKILKDLPYAIIWPDSSWDDIEGTERELWINSKGYGYFMCDEPNPVYWKGKGLEPLKWNILKSKIENVNVTYDDIKGTALEELLNKLYIDYEFEDKSELNKDLKNLLNLKNDVSDVLYAIKGDMGPIFFNSEIEFKAEYERDWADVLWEDLPDETLNKWITRLTNESEPDLYNWLTRNKLEQ